VYILASERNGAIYTGVTRDLHDRMPQHKQGPIGCRFTGRSAAYAGRSAPYQLGGALAWRD
jgi:predicted GIY-YIG superfamily endonuclease